MRRKLLNLCSALSLTLCLAIGVLWVRSYFVSDAVPLSLDRRSYELRSQNGMLRVRNQPFIAWDAQVHANLRERDAMNLASTQLGKRNLAISSILAARALTQQEEAELRKIGADAAQLSRRIIAQPPLPPRPMEVGVTVPHVIPLLYATLAPALWLGRRRRRDRGRQSTWVRALAITLVLWTPFFVLVSLHPPRLWLTLSSQVAAMLAQWYLLGRPANIRRRRKKLGQCLRCGYDLRATPGRCPECGTEPEPAAAPAAG